MYCLLRQTALRCDARYFVIKDASHAAFRLRPFQKLSDSFVLRLRWYVRLSFLRCLKLTFANDENIVVGNALKLQDLATGSLFSL